VQAKPQRIRRYQRRKNQNIQNKIFKEDKTVLLKFGSKNQKKLSFSANRMGRKSKTQGEDRVDKKTMKQKIWFECP
jgi:hypothetical protein